MIIDERYKSNLISMIGDTAVKWFEELPSIIEKCIIKWELSDLIPYEDLSYNYVCYGKSKIYGDIVLKAGFPHKELYTEMDALKDFKDDYVCDIYDSCKTLNAMILECVTPGKTLWSVEDDTQKVIIAAQVIESIPVKIEDESKYPTHLNWIEKAFLKFRNNNDMSHRLYNHLTNVENLYHDLDVLGNEMLLIHGDLHHSNIISSDSTWKVIDPKGAIGFRSLEVGRFMNNHYPSVDNKEEQLDFMLSEFSKVFSLSREIILKSFYVDSVLSLVWTFEDVEVDMEYANSKIIQCETLYRYICEKTLN